MSTKHYFPSTAANTLVPRALRALVTSNPHLDLNEPERVIADAYRDTSTVSIIGGGGSGHEPAWSGFVGEGLLAAAACGDIFASPSTKQVLAAMRMAPSEKGTIFLVTNYTGDRLHFGLAAERARAEGLAENVIVLPATDDVSIGRSKSSRVGRRGLPGHVFTMKILCAAAAENASFERCVEIGRAINDNTVSIGSSLDHCHVPGRAHQSVAEDTCTVGAGIHNEPAQQVLSPTPSPEDLIKRCLTLLCDESDAERAFTAFDAGDAVMLLMNNYGGLSVLELGALTDEVQTQLASSWGIKPVRTLSGSFETSLNAPGFSVSLFNVTKAAETLETSVEELIALFDRPTTAVSWPNIMRPSPERKRSTPIDVNGNHKTTTSTSASIKVDPQLLEKGVRTACQQAIAAEPKLTEWDMVMGDGDCGEAVKGLAESLLRQLDSGVASSGSVISFLASVIETTDDMGGTLGAIFGILLSAFSAAIQSKAKEHASLPMLYASSLAAAVESLKSHTSAREGDRTVMDVLLPFAEEFAKRGDLVAGVRVAEEKAEATRYLGAKFGRATYVGEASAQELPDPGAWALYEILDGLAKGLGASGNWKRSETQ